MIEDIELRINELVNNNAMLKLGINCNYGLGISSNYEDNIFYDYNNNKKEIKQLENKKLRLKKLENILN
jgi:hypothetical protein